LSADSNAALTARSVREMSFGNPIIGNVSAILVHVGQMVVHDLIGTRWIFTVFVDDTRGRLRIEIALRREITINASAREPSFRHHIVDRKASKPWRLNNLPAL